MRSFSIINTHIIYVGVTLSGDKTVKDKSIKMQHNEKKNT